MSEQTKIGKLRGRIKSGPISFEEMCNYLDLSPRRAKDFLRKHPDLHVENDHIGLPRPASGDSHDKINKIGPAPVTGQTYKIAHISDTHLGSKYCLREELKDFINFAYYERGVRIITHSGDILDGDYRHGKFEMSHMGIEEQTQDLFETLPRLEGLSYHAITGNHDFTFTDQSGVSVGDFITRFFKERGRNDFRAYGDRSAMLLFGGAKVHLWHPGGGMSYAKSYKLQKRIESYEPGHKPNILLVGHFHQDCAVYERGVHAFLCRTFQGGGSAFGNMLGSTVAIGGMILEWELTGSGVMRNLRVEKRTYFEKEHAFHIDVPYGMEAETSTARRGGLDGHNRYGSSGSSNGAGSLVDAKSKHSKVAKLSGKLPSRERVGDAQARRTGRSVSGTSSHKGHRGRK